jgi:hypothetical protein
LGPGISSFEIMLFLMGPWNFLKFKGFFETDRTPDSLQVNKVVCETDRALVYLEVT